MLRALRKSIFWIIIIILDIITFVYDRFFLQTDAHLFTITFLVTCISQFPKSETTIKNLKNKKISLIIKKFSNPFQILILAICFVSALF